MRKEQSAGAVIFHENGNRKYLLLHYKSGHWDFVKGHIEEGETEKQTIRREAKEETDIEDLEFVKGFREKIKYYFRKNYSEKDSQSKGTLIFKEVFFYLAQTKTKEVTLSWEHIGYEWLGFEEALERITFSNAKDILKKAEDYLNKKQ